MAGLVVAPALPAPPHNGAPSLAEPQKQHSGVPFDMYDDLILTRDVSERGLRAGDVGTVVEQHAVPGVAEEGYSVEFFDMTGNTLAVVTLPASALRLPTPADRPAVRALGA
jgi:hypothetical protein